MKTNLEYIRAFFGERGESEPLFTDDELQNIMNGHLVHRMTPALEKKLARENVEYSVVDDSCLLLLTLKREVRESEDIEVFYAGVGNWQDTAGKLEVGEEEHELAPGEFIDTLHGRVGLTGPLPGVTKVLMVTYLLDIRAVLIELTRILKASRARLAVKAQLAGLNVDLSQVSRRLEKEIEELSTSYELPFNLPEDFPH
ncbi:MAG: hypothetical protein B1H03_04150 [Planctomycetales bacterium 4484_113]|nr:MAG: hypothetical protein B1H03_04150 [Planctomycetales bacterium 4484_113]